MRASIHCIAQKAWSTVVLNEKIKPKHRINEGRIPGDPFFNGLELFSANLKLMPFDPNGEAQIIFDQRQNLIYGPQNVLRL